MTIPLNAPAHELNRSHAAQRVGRLAAASNLFMAHFEHRVTEPPPEFWLPQDRPDLGEPQAWHAGILAEAKYQSFRTDLMIASFHPGHRAKWTAHELCHGLVGFAWRPDAPLLFHACAARLAELLPVALFYFFDEAGLNRCEDHLDGGPLFAHFCLACEEAAKQGPRDHDPNAQVWYDEGVRFVQRELEAVDRSLRTGRAIASPWGSLDLCSDGLAYAAAQGPRLKSTEYAKFIERFFPKGTGRHEHLDDLIQRISELTSYLIGEGDADPWPLTSERYAARDLAWRIIEVMVQCPFDIANQLRRLLDFLDGDTPNLAKTIEGYEDLHDDFELPDPVDLFAVGYDLPGDYGRSARQIGEGLATVCPMTLAKLEKANAAIGRFAVADTFERRPVGERFATWLAEEQSGHAADLAHFESSATYLPPRDAATETLNAEAKYQPSLMADEYQINPAIRLLTSTWETMIDIGAVQEPESEDPPLLALSRNPNGEEDPVIIAINPMAFEYLQALQNGETPPILEEAFLAELIAHDVITPQSYPHQT